MESGGIIYLIYLTAPLRLTWITHPITPNRAVDKFGINGAGIEPWTEYHLDTSTNQLSQKTGLIKSGGMIYLTLASILH
jgi:hypothetical protein